MIENENEFQNNSEQNYDEKETINIIGTNITNHSITSLFDHKLLAIILDISHFCFCFLIFSDSNFLKSKNCFISLLKDSFSWRTLFFSDEIKKVKLSNGRKTKIATWKLHTVENW